MSEPAVIVSAPARLHLGLVKTSAKPGFIAGGLSLAKPRLKIKVTLSQNPGRGAPSPAENAAEAVLRHIGRAEKAYVETLLPLPAHQGFGSGTRMALAAAAGALKLAGERMDALEMARLAGRGERSAMGSALFAQGGVAVDIEGEIVRAAIPKDWRVVIIFPTLDGQNRAGLHGGPEDSMISGVPPCSTIIRNRLADATVAGLIGGALKGDFPLFESGVEALQRAAEKRFGPFQGGAASTRGGRAILAWLRKEGVKACGQSSWGPALFAICPAAAEAEDLEKALVGRADIGGVQVTRISNTGRRLTAR